MGSELGGKDSRTQWVLCGSGRGADPQMPCYRLCCGVTTLLGVLRNDVSGKETVGTGGLG